MLSNNNYRRSSDYGRSRGGRDDPTDASLAGRASSSSMARGEGSAALPTVKLVLVGDQSVGKSSLIARYTRGDFAGDTVATVGVEFFSKIVSVGGGHGDVRVQVWDTAGQERHRSLTKQVFRGARGVMIVYDITNRASFEALPMWLSEIKAEVHATCCFMLVGNKYDLVADASSAGGGGGGGYDNNGYDSRDRDRGGGRGYARHHGSGRSQPPSPSSNSNYYNPETPKSNGHFNNNNNNNNFYPNARHPPIPLSPSSASSTRGRSPPMPPLHRHQRSNSFQKYAFTSGGSGSTPTSNSQCTTPSNRREEGGRERERVRGERRGYDDDCRSLGGSDRSRHNYDGTGSTTSSGAYRYPNESSGHRAPPPDLGQTQRYVFTSGGRGTTRDDGGHGPPTPSSSSRGGGGGRGGDHYQQQQPRPKGMAGAARGLISGRPRSRQVNLREADEFARANGMSFLETSAKDHTNVERAFTWIVQNVMESSASFVPPSRGGGGYMYENEGRGGGGGAYNNNNYNPYRGGGGGGEGYNRNSVNLSGKDRPRRGGPKGAGEGYSAAANDSDDDSRDGRSRCPC